jgi:hypothetical protein
MLTRIPIEETEHHHHAAPNSVVGIAVRAWDSGLPRFQRWLISRRLENRVKVLLKYFEVSLQAVDRGTAHFQFNIVNFSESQLSVGHIELNHWKVGQRSMSERDEFIKAWGTVNGASIEQGGFNLALGTADIRDIIGGVPDAQNSKSSPEAYLEARGICVVKKGTKEVRVPFDFNQRAVGLIIPSALIAELSAIKP